MRLLITFTFLLLFSASNSFAQMNEAAVSPELLEALAENPGEKVPFYIVMADRVDVLALHQEFYARGAGMQERVSTLLPLLQAKAANTQGPILDILRKSDHVLQSSIAPMWAANVIYVEGSKEIVEELSNRHDIMILENHEKVYLLEYEEAEECAPPSPNGRETGHTAIKAPFLWNLGYTGYGSNAMIIDTGSDFVHPALKANYRGYYGGHEGANTVGNEFPYDCANHGTHVTGTVCGIVRATNDTIGVAFNAKWMAGPSIECGASVSPLGIFQTFQWALNPDGDSNTSDDMPIAINNSWGGGAQPCSAAYIDLFNTMEAAGVAIVFSAGNSGPGSSTTTTPVNINTNLVNSFAVGNINANNPSLPINGGSSRGPSVCGGTGSLLIKPEVSAPGTGVRSSITGGGFANFTGTSMAAPHVTGAICLLKEVFPELIGEELKLALYHSCTDLGVTGEDNVYGMGIINLEAAYNYLINEGHTPADPTVENDALIVDMDVEDRNCGGVFTGSVQFENAGTVNLTSLGIQYSLIGSSGTSALTGVHDWTGDLAPGERTTFEMPETVGPDGAYQLEVELVEPNGVADLRPLNNKQFRDIVVAAVDPLVPQIFGVVNPCSNSNVVLFVDYPGALVNWYLSETSTTPVHVGNYFETPPFNNDFTFYADAVVESHVGIENKDDVASEIGANEIRGLKFDSYVPFKLKSVKVYNEAPGFRLITLSTSNGNILKQKTFNPSQPGEQEIILNFDVPAQNNLELKLAAGAALYHSTEASYPYNTSGVMAITGTTDFTNPQDNYYYFYDWIIEAEYVCGRAAIEVDFQSSSNKPVVNYQPSENPVSLIAGQAEVSFVNSTLNGESYLWSFGDGNTSTEENPTHIYTEVGTYTVVLQASNSSGCSDAMVVDVEVILGTGLNPAEVQNQIKVFPNPTAQEVNVAFQFDKSQDVDVVVTDMIGRQIQQYETRAYQNDLLQVDLNGYANGIYYIVFKIDGMRVAKKIVKMN